jgi:hypothetical protein
VCPARPCQGEGQASRFQPAIALAEARIHDVARQVRETAPRVRAVQELDIIESPRTLGRDEITLSPGTVVGASDEQIPLMAQPEVDSLLEVVEECHTLADQLDLLGVVELQPKGTRGDRRGQCGKRGPFFEDDRFQAGALGEEGSGAADDAAADDDEIGALGR